VSALWHEDISGWKLLAPVGFPTEQELHSLVEDAPHVLPLSGSPRLVVVGREVALGGGSADLVAMKPTGRLVVIEAKLRRNPEARRAVVAQILAYAAHLYGLNRETVEREILGDHLRTRGYTSLADAVAHDNENGLFDPEGFGDALSAGLEKGRFRLILVLDDAPPDLARLVGYLEAMTPELVIDLVTVAQYTIGDSRVLVPQRVEPERVVSEALAPRAQATYRTPGTAEFRTWIRDLPAHRQRPLTRLADWVETLEDEGLVRAFTSHGKTGNKNLIPVLRGYDAGLVTVWSNASLWIYPKALQRLAPSRLQEIERLASGDLSKAVPEPSAELLAALTEAHRDAAAGVKSD
jgi:hypothetical protein